MEHVSSADRERVEAVDGVHLTQLAVGDRTSVQAFRMEPGSAVEAHDHPHEQAGFLYQGELTFTLADGTERVVGAGESFLFRGEETHAAENRGDEPVLGVDVFAPPRPNPDWQR
ncbi:MAG: cupin domain-containing protein [Halobacteriales archaeon]|nr:cupin domain-containing protein [Halobacteriales archaeon]